MVLALAISLYFFCYWY